MGTSRLLSDQVSAVERHQGALPEKDAVHEMRVAARRLRAALRVLRLRELDPAVKSLQDALGEVRDLQIQVDWLRGRDRALHRSHQTRLSKAELALQRELGKWHSRTLPALLAATAGNSTPSSRKIAKMLRKRIDRLEERLERARRRLTPNSLHRARISVKQVRYILEVGQASLPRKAVQFEADLKSLQTSLGELHDVDVRIGLVKGKPALLRDQKEAREKLAKIVAAQLGRWQKRKVADRVRRVL
jgi:CHAD domain-containing protein